MSGKHISFSRINNKYKSLQQNDKDAEILYLEQNNKDIAVIGISLRLASADNLESYWSNITNKINCISKLQNDRLSDIEEYMKFKEKDFSDLKFLECAYLDNIDKFDYKFFRISPKEASLMSPHQRIFLQTVWNAIEDAGYGENKIVGSDTGVYLGIIGDLDGYKYKEIIHETNPEDLPISVQGNLGSIISSRISYLLNLKGPSMLIDTACSSSLVAVHTACRALRNGDCAMAIAGSVRVDLLPIDKEYYKIGTESSDGITRTFDEEADGTGLGEGSVAVILKPLSAAERDKDKIYAVIKGSAVNQDGRSAGLTAPNPLSQANVMVKAWRDANIDPQTITYIEAHGTGTKLGDPIEIEGINKAFNRCTEKKQFCAISSVKTNIGHLYECSGIASLVKAIIALNKKELPPTNFFNKPNKNINFTESPIYVNTKNRRWDVEELPRRCGVSSFGISGTNCHVVLEEYDKEDESELVNAKSIENNVQILTISAKSKVSLQLLVIKFMEFVNCAKESEFMKICYMTNTARGHYKYRLAILTNSIEDLCKKLNKVRDSDFTTLKQDWFFYNELVFENDKLFGNIKTANEKNEDFLSLHMEDTISELRINHNLAQSYVDGKDINWTSIYKGYHMQKVSVPGYAFENTRCWLNIPLLASDSAKYSYYDNFFFKVKWKKISNMNKIDKYFKGNVIVIYSDYNLIKDILYQVRKMYKNILEVEIGVNYKKVNEFKYEISGCEEDYKRLINELKLSELSMIIHLCSISGDAKITSVDKLKDNQERGVFSLFYLTKAIMNYKLDNMLNIVLISDYVNEVVGTESRINYENATLFGLGKVVNLESDSIKCRCIDIDNNSTAKDIAEELKRNDEGYVVALRDGSRYVEEFGQINIEDYPERNIDIKDNGVYVITGGTGAIGLNMSKYLTLKNNVKLALINRSSLPKRDKWEELLKLGRDKTLCEKLKNIIEIENMGATVECYSADVSNFDEMNQIFNGLRSKYGKINGIIHSAGITSHCAIYRRHRNDFDQVISPKVYGTWILNKVTEKDQLDFFIMCSSGISIMGDTGLGDYTAANSFIDSYCSYLDMCGKNVLTVNWVLWKGNGMGEQATKKLDTIFKAISPQDAIAVFDKVLHRNIKRILIGDLNYEGNQIKIIDKLNFQISNDLKLKIVQNLKGNVSVGFSNKIKENKSVILSEKGQDRKFTDLELKIASVWGKFLGNEELDINDNFYELGGDSISGLRIANEINKLLGININAADLMKFETINKLSKHIKDELDKGLSKENSVIYTTIPLISEGNYYDEEHYPSGCYPASSAQKRQFILNEIDKNSISYNISNALVIQGRLDICRLEEAFNSLIQRHETLRTSFKVLDNEIVQVVHELKHFNIEVVEAEESIIDSIIRDFIKPFDLFTAPLIRIKLIKLDELKNILLIDMSHIITDGVSMDILIRDITSFYKKNSLENLRVQYKDFSAWQNKMLTSKEFIVHEKYWIDKFDEKLNGELPVLNLPTDYPRQSVKSYEGDVEVFKVDKVLTAKLNRLGVETGTTLYMIFVSAFSILLSKYSGMEDIIVGSPIAGRTHADFKDIIGMFVNTLAIRSKPKGEKSFVNYLMEVKQTSLEAYEHQDYQFDELVNKLGLERDLSRNPIFDVSFMLQHVKERNINIKDLKFSKYNFDTRISKFDITLEAAEVEDEIVFNVEYCTKLFKKETIKRLIGHYLNILDKIVGDSSIHISNIDMMSEQEKASILEYNNTYCDYPKDLTINELFEAQANKNPDNKALVFGDKYLTYKELNERSNQVARTIMREVNQNKSIVQNGNKIIGVMVDRSLEMIIAILGVLKSGAAYLPIDPSYPEERIKHMLEDSGTRYVVSKRKFLDRESIKGINFIDIADETINTLDDSNISLGTTSGELAYVIYTSGSTGKPKGVMIEHKSVVNLITGITNFIQFTEDRSILALTTISFDIFVLETLLALSKGLKIIIANEMEQLDPNLLSKLIIKNKIDMLQITPSRMSLIINNQNDLQCLRDIKDIMIGGEAFPERLLSELKKHTKANIFNMYGPTETTVWSTIKNLTLDENITIGGAIANTKIYILDKYKNILPIGIEGELYIGGDGLSRGYFNQEELTKEKFIENPFVPGEKIYKTGDLAKWLDNKEIECCGRVDHQVKIRGYRIELGEIESVLNSHKFISEAAVIVKENNNGIKYICAFLVLGEQLSTGEIREYLSKHLPEYMIPSHFIFIDKLPLTPNGKIDRRNLLNKEIMIDAEIEVTEPSNEIESKLVEMWKKVLEVSVVGVNKKFFEVGGSSLLLVQLQNEIEKVYPGIVTVADLFTYSSISKIAEFISQSNEKTKKIEDIPRLILPEEFFVNQYKTTELLGKSGAYEYRIEDNIFNNLKKLALHEGIDLKVILISAYVYVLHKFSNQPNIPIHVAADNTNLIYEIEVDVENIDDFADLLMVVDNALMNSKSIKLYQLNIAALSLRVKEHEITPLFAISGVLDSSFNSTKIYGMSVDVSIEDMYINILYQFDEEIISDKKAEQFFKGYLKFVKAIADNH